SRRLRDAAAAVRAGPVIALMDRSVGEPDGAAARALHPRAAQLTGELEHGGDDAVPEHRQLDRVGDLAADHPEGMAHGGGVQQLADPRLGVVPEVVDPDLCHAATSLE